jgi:hypothetical protein
VFLAATHRQGWLLCIEGARQASCTASLSTSAFAIGLVMTITRLPSS